MIVYLLIIGYVFLIGVISKQLVLSGSITSKYNNYTNLVFAILIFALPVYFIGLRTSVADTSAYINGFERLVPDFSLVHVDLLKSRGFGWDFFTIFFKKFVSQDVYLYLMTIAIIQAGALIKLYYKYSADYPYSILLLFLSGSFTYMMNGIRQFLAISIILYFSDYIFEKKNLRFVIVVLVASTIHLSVILWIFALFFVQGKTANIKMIILAFGLLLAITFVDTFTNLLDDALSETTYSNSLEHVSKDTGSSFIRTLIFAIPVGVAFLGRDELKKKEDTVTSTLINISIMGVMTSLLANFTSGILIGRLPTNFVVFNYALFPRLFAKGFNEKQGKTIRMGCTVVYVLFFVYYYIFHSPLTYHSIPLGLRLN